MTTCTNLPPPLLHEEFPSIDSVTYRVVNKRLKDFFSSVLYYCYITVLLLLLLCIIYCTGNVLLRRLCERLCKSQEVRMYLMTNNPQD